MMVEKICGADVELGNFVEGPRATRTSPGDAAIALLAEIDGIPHRQSIFGSQLMLPSSILETDRGRKYLPTNGGCAYIDLDHLEICLPEVASAWDHVAAWHAMLHVAREAQRAANDERRRGRIQVLVNNSDGLGASYGSHLDFLVTRRAWDDIFVRKLHPLLFLAAYQASSIVFAGQGKVGSENGAPAAAFQISQRADFIETLVGPQTTYRRPLVNSRDEALADEAELARLHVICYDSTLCHAAHLLKVGAMQIILAMIEAEQTDLALVLDDAVGAIRRWSHDPALEHRERLTNGRLVTAVELQRMFVELARPFVESSACEKVVPRAAEILALWDDTIARFESGDFETLSRRIDWVLKLSILRSVQEARGFDWRAPEMKHLDHMFANLDYAEGLFWAYEREGLVDRVVSQDEIDRLVVEPPADTRAWARAMLLRELGRDGITEIDWDSVQVRTGAWGKTRRIDMPDPRSAACGELVAAGEQVATRRLT